MWTTATLPLKQRPLLAGYRTITLVASPAPACKNTAAQCVAQKHFSSLYASYSASCVPGTSRPASCLEQVRGVDVGV